MTNKLLSTPLSSFFKFRRTLTSIPQRLSPHLKPQSSSPPFVPPYDIDNLCDGYPTSYYYSSLGSLRFCRKSLCSKPEEKFQITCWNCHDVPQSAPFLFCQSCRCVQPVDHSIDYFEIFGTEKKYDVEGINLEGKYKEWQKKLHPDLVHSKSQKEKDFAAEQSGRVIDAYRTLSKPLSRAIYMLEGVEIDEEQTISDPELLAEIMEIREEVEEATNSEALNHIRSQMQEKLQNWSNAFADAFERRDFEEAKNVIRRMRYYSRVIEEVVKKL
ncbi:iron-sulfur cluster co-chaperone protein HscB homolog isoform X2 [Vicia villosa]|uniref:iron-sulfur cluster co-chaperone protein HscB homolog isoform X2 n=1 Tax=Vicia villosa TaxID=3911 RepID=UPI00273C5DA6|nr:iron-sulfur cluster co-chaperone protein HscB homolog isoform X2 [Vicia villosa]